MYIIANYVEVCIVYLKLNCNVVAQALIQVRQV